MKVEIKVLVDINFIEALDDPLPKELQMELAEAARFAVWRALKDIEGEGFQHELAEDTSMEVRDVDLIRPKFGKRGPKEWIPAPPE